MYIIVLCYTEGLFVYLPRVSDIFGMVCKQHSPAHYALLPTVEPHENVVCKIRNCFTNKVKFALCTSH